MRIESLHIDKFGKLRSFDLAFPEGLTIVRGDNESGKTTILAFLRAMLYGLNGKSASIAQNDRRKYMPWGETSMGGSLRLTDGRSAWEIARVFGQTKKQDTLRVTDLASGEAVELPAGDEPGRVLLGVDEAVFADTLYVSARGSRPSGDGAALTDKIRNLVGTGSEDVDLKSVLDRLRAAKNAIAPRPKDKGQLAAVQREQDEVQRALLASAQEQQELARLRERVQALSDASVPAAGRATAALRERIAEKERAALRLADYRRQVDALDARIAALEAQALPEKAAAAAGRPTAAGRATAASRAPELLFLALALLVSAASVACGLLFTNYAFAGLIATAGLSVLYMRAKDAREAAEEAPAAAAAAPEAGRELAAARRERAMYVQQSERLAGQIAQMEAAIEAEMAPPDPARQEALISARVELEALEKRAGDPAALRARLAALKSRESALLQRLAALDMAEQALGEAARERQQGFAPELAGHVERILSRVTAGKYARAAISQSLEISLQPGAGALQPWEFFSGGTVELMYLALRLGLIRMLEKHSGPLPALLDDPFVLLDDARCREALGVLRDAAQAGSQVLLFTCQDRTVLPGANVLELDP